MRRAAGRVMIAVVVAAAVFVAAVAITQVIEGDEPVAGAAVGTVVPRLTAASPAARTLDAYAGFGVWVDGFDFGPAYQPAGVAPPVGAAAIDEMVAQGARTLYLQAARRDDRSPGGIVDRALVGQLLLRAHRRGLRVVAWYLPTFADPAVDRANLERLHRFEVLGHRFDGIALDIEYTDDVPDTDQRNARLIELSVILRALVGNDALGAIVLPPVLTEVVNERYWPDFPWGELRDLYDVWLPMSYWTFRSTSSGYQDGYAYNEESTRRLRNNLGDPDALVHGIGGIGDVAPPEALAEFVRSLAETASIGGSIYDWNVTPPEWRTAIAQLFATGPGATLPRPHS